MEQASDCFDRNASWCTSWQSLSFTENFTENCHFYKCVSVSQYLTAREIKLNINAQKRSSPTHSSHRTCVKWTKNNNTKTGAIHWISSCEEAKTRYVMHIFVSKYLFLYFFYQEKLLLTFSGKEKLNKSSCVPWEIVTLVSSDTRVGRWWQWNIPFKANLSAEGATRLINQT